MTFILIPPVISEADTMRDCPICEGSGLAWISFKEGTVDLAYRQSCPECGGSGQLSRDRGARSSLD
jgi:DnaJ-class molecular chaperone